MSKNIKETIRRNLNTLLETKGFEHMEVAFGVKEKSDNLSDAEKNQFGEMKTIQTEKGVNLGKSSVQPALDKVRKEDKEDEDVYFKDVEKKMKVFQTTSESEPSQIGESSDRGININDMTENEFLEKMLGPKYKSAPLEKITAAMKAYEDLKKANPVNETFDPPKVNREDDQTEPEDVYSTEALGPGMLALRYDNEGTPVYDKFEKRMDDLNGDDLSYKKLKGYGQKYLKHKYGTPDEYHYTPKVRTTDKPINETYIDVLEENIFKVKGTIKSKKQVINLVDKLPNRVRVDETVFAVTDGENEYRLMWEGSRDGEAVITHEKNVNIVNENINKMKHLWEFKSSDSNKKVIKESNDVFFKMMNKVRGKESLNESVHKKKSPVPGKSKPRFGGMELKFDSEVDMALYILFNPKLKSKAEPKFLEWASSLGYTQEQKDSEGKEIKNYIKNEVQKKKEFPGWKQKWYLMTGEIVIPKMASEPKNQKF